MKKFFLVIMALSLVGCATLTEDAMTPVALSFSDGSDGECTLQNKRGIWTTQMPNTVSIRKSDDTLIYRCETEDGRKVVGGIESEMGAKIVASAIFLDFGIVDSITDKHRKYAGSFVIPIAKGVTEPATMKTAEVSEADTVQVGAVVNTSDKVSPGSQDTFRTKCSKCGNIISYKAEEAGTTAKCVKCENGVELL